jgi:hypothetical protein
MIPDHINVPRVWGMVILTFNKLYGILVYADNRADLLNTRNAQYIYY